MDSYPFAHTGPIWKRGKPRPRGGTRLRAGASRRARRRRREARRGLRRLGDSRPRGAIRGGPAKARSAAPVTSAPARGEDPRSIRRLRMAGVRCHGDEEDGTRRSGSSPTEASRPRPRRDPKASLQLAHRKSLRGMDPPLHPVSRKTASRFDGKGGDRRIPHAPRDREARERIHAEPGPERAPVPLPPRSGNEDSLDRGDRKTSTSAAASRSADANGGPSPPLQDERHHLAHGSASLPVVSSTYPI